MFGSFVSSGRTVRQEPGEGHAALHRHAALPQGKSPSRFYRQSTFGRAAVFLTASTSCLCAVGVRHVGPSEAQHGDDGGGGRSSVHARVSAPSESMKHSTKPAWLLRLHGEQVNVTGGALTHSAFV